MTPGRSLVIKLSLPAIVTAVVVWVGWPVEKPVSRQPPTTPTPLTLAAAARPPDTARPEIAAQASRPSTASGRLDLNRATLEELERLPGIGPVLAKRMIDQRTTSGRFKAVDDLLRVKGIGRKRLEQLRPLLTVGKDRL